MPSNTSRPSALATTRLATMRIFACVLDRVCGSRLPLASAARQLRSSATPRVTKGLRLRWHHAIGCRGRLFCLNGRKRRPREIGARSRASPRHYRPSSHRLFCRGRSAARSCHRRRGSRLILYWGAHPFRADRLARALAARSGAPSGWSWRVSNNPENGLPATFRTPPAPYRERSNALGPGFCCVCGQPVYRFGWHIDLWETGPNKNAVWHCACVIAWQFWNAPSSQARLLRRLQARRCGETGGRLWKSAEVDHRVPLFRLWNEYRDAPWAELLDYWGLPNLQMVNRDAHAAKCATEARGRRAGRHLASKSI